MRSITKQLDMSPGAVSPVVHVSQYDSDFTIVFTLYCTDGTFTLESGTTAEIRGTKRSGTGYSATATIDSTDGTVTVTGDNQMTAVAGKNTYEIVLFKSGKQLSSINFVLFCEPAALDADTVKDDSVIKEFNNFESKIADATNAARRAETAASKAENKTNVPLVGGKPYYGENGQTLRTKGNGVTEWASVGLPTDAQTGTAVSNWLDQHPEATTTVQDRSIGKTKITNDFLTKISNYVDPMDYGAVGDGETDDSEAVRLASLDGVIRNTENVFLIGESVRISNGMKDTTFKLLWDKTIIVDAEKAVIDGCDFSQYEIVKEEGNRGEWLLSVNKNNIKIINCTFHDAPNCVSISADLKNIELSNNHFANIASSTFLGGNGYGILLQNATKNISIKNNIFTNVERHCIYITRDYWETYPVVATNVYITGNRFVFEDGITQINTVQIAISIRGAKNLFIENNYFYGYTTVWNYNCAMHGFENVYTRNNVIEHMGYNGSINYAMTTFYFTGADYSDPAPIKNIVITDNIVKDSAVGFINVGFGDYTILRNDVEIIFDNRAVFAVFIVHVNDKTQTASLRLKNNNITYVNPNNMPTSLVCLYGIKESNPGATYTIMEISGNMYTGEKIFSSSAGDDSYGLLIQMLKIADNVFFVETASSGFRANASYLYTVGNVVFVNGVKGKNDITFMQFEDVSLNDDAITVYLGNTQRKHGGNLIVNDRNEYVPLAMHINKIDGVEFVNGIATVTLPNNVYNRMATAMVISGTNITRSLNIIRCINNEMNLEFTDKTFSGTTDIFVLYMSQRM